MYYLLRAPEGNQGKFKLSIEGRIGIQTASAICFNFFFQQILPERFALNWDSVRISWAWRLA